MYFPSHYTPSEPADNLPATTLVRVHRTLYGGKGSDSHLSSLPTEADIVSTCEACYEIDSVYENPLFTFYNRPAITQAFTLSRFVSSSRLPLPSQLVRSAAASLGSLLGLSRPTPRRRRRSSGEHPPDADTDEHDGKDYHRGWEIATVWSEFGDTAESDSFDGSHLGILSHTLHISFLPSLPIIGSHTQIRLRTLTLLQFNESGLVTFHRDHWDVRDIIEGCIPFASSLGAVTRWGAGWGVRLLGGVAGALDLNEIVGRFEKEAEEMRRVVKEEVMVVAERARVVSSPRVVTDAGLSSMPFPSGTHGLGSTTSLAASNASTSATTSPQSSMFYLRPTVTTPTVSNIPPPLTSPTTGTAGRGSTTTTRRRKTISRPWGSGGYSSVTSLAELLSHEEQRAQEGGGSGYVDEQSRNALGLSQDGDGMGVMGHAPDVDQGGDSSGEVWRR